MGCVLWLHPIPKFILANEQGVTYNQIRNNQRIVLV